MKVPNVKPTIPFVVPPGLHLQLPLDIPDFARRTKVKPRPVRQVLYFDGGLEHPATVHDSRLSGTQSAF
jgi:hypothetical protein